MGPVQAAHSQHDMRVAPCVPALSNKTSLTRAEAGWTGAFLGQEQKILYRVGCRGSGVTDTSRRNVFFLLACPYPSFCVTVTGIPTFSEIPRDLLALLARLRSQLLGS